MNYDFHQGRKLGRRDDAFVANVVLEAKSSTIKSFDEILSRPTSAVSNKSLTQANRHPSKLSLASTFSGKRNSVSPQAQA